jgi:hypothetical protein
VGFAERVSVRCKYLTIYRKDIKVTAREIRSLVIAAVYGLLALCGSAGGSEPIEGLIAHWKFDESSRTTAYDSVGGNHGTIYGADWTTGRLGGALDFDGVDDYVDLGNDSSLKPPLPVTLSAWIWFSQNDATLISLDDCSDKYYGVTLNIKGVLSVGFGDGNGWGSSNYRRSKQGTTALNPNTWYHVAAVVRGATDMSLYVNGADDGGTYSGTGGSLAYSSGNASIATAHSAGIYFNGKIDDVRVYERALSAEEIQELYPEGLSGPIAHWKFDEGSGTTAYDSAGGNHGTIYGAGWTDGQIDGALSFDGDGDYVDLGNDNSLKPPLPVTLSAWIRFSQNNATLISLDDLSSKYCGLWLNINLENHLSVAFGDGNGWGAVRYRRSKAGTTVLNADTWYHIAAVVRGTKDMSLYINGVDDGGSYSGTGGSLAYSRGNASIGTAHFENKYFNGEMDDVRIYNGALSAEEIRQLYQSRESGEGLPVGPMVVVNNIERAICEKVEAWKRIDDTLKKEWATYDALEEMLRSGDYGDLSYSGIVTARQEIYSAIQQDERSKEALEKSIEELEDALAALGFELEPKPTVWLEQAKRPVP